MCTHRSFSFKANICDIQKCVWRHSWVLRRKSVEKQRLKRKRKIQEIEGYFSILFYVQMYMVRKVNTNRISNKCVFALA